MWKASEDAAAASLPYLVQAVARTAAILEAFEGGEALSLAELTQRTGIPKPSVFRLATTLESVGLLDRDRNGSYVLGMRLVSLAQFYLSLSLTQASRPVMEDLNRSFGHTINLAVLDHGEMVFVEVLESRNSFRMATTIGAREPLHATALGKAVAAHLPDAEFTPILGEHPLRALTANTIVTRPQLDKELELIRARGWATDIGESYAGAHAVGAAVFDRHGVAGGISISASSSQLPVDELPATGAALVRAADTISRMLGAFRPPRPAVQQHHVSVVSDDPQAAGPRRTVEVVQAVAKTAAILEAFDSGESLSLAQLTQRTGIPKPSVFRLATTLESFNLLGRDRAGAYVLGMKTVSLARGVLARTVPEVARSVMRETHSAFGHTVNLAVLDRGEMCFVEVLQSRNSFRMAVAIGARETLFSTAIGKAVAAHLPDEELNRILAKRPPVRLTPKTITSPARLKEELKLIRERGYATDIEECHIGAHCAGVPLFNRSGVWGGMSISAPSSELPVDELPVIGSVLDDAGRRISSALGADTAHRSPGQPASE